MRLVWIEFSLAAWTVCWKQTFILNWKSPTVQDAYFSQYHSLVMLGWLCVVCKSTVFLYSLNRVVNSRPHCMKMVLSEGPVEPSSSSPNSGSTHAGPHLGTRKRSRRRRLTKWWDEDCSLPPDVCSNTCAFIEPCRYCTRRCLCSITVKSTAWNKVFRMTQCCKEWLVTYIHSHATYLVAIV